MSTVLIVEDERDIAELVAFNLEREGYFVASAYDGISGLEKAYEMQPDLIILDQMMPGMDGMKVLKELRRDARTQLTPVIFLTAKAQTQERIEGLQAGADDYVTKPFSPKELVLRVTTVLKRVQKKPGVVEFVLGPFRFDKNALKFYIEGEGVDLTSTEFKLLMYFVEREGVVLDRQNLLRSVWGYSDDVYSRTLDTHMKRVRQKLGKYSSCIETIRHVGYKFVLPEENKVKE